MSGGTKRPHKRGTGKGQGLQRPCFEWFGFRHGVEPPSQWENHRTVVLFNQLQAFQSPFWSVL